MFSYPDLVSSSKKYACWVSDLDYSHPQKSKGWPLIERRQYNSLKLDLDWFTYDYRSEILISSKKKKKDYSQIQNKTNE